MTAQTLTVLLSLAAALLAVGLFGVLARRTILFQLLALELMLGGPALAFVATGAHHGDPAGQAMFVLVLAFAATKAALGLTLFFRLRRTTRNADADDLEELGG